MKVLVIGGEGMLGHKVFQVLSNRFETYATFNDFGGLWRTFPMYKEIPERLIPGVNVIDFDSVVRAISYAKPDAIVNCVGIIKQLDASNDTLISLEINSIFPHRLANFCNAAGIKMVHMSTDCVYSGSKGMYTEDMLTDVSDLYGLSKYLGELKDNPAALTVRTSIFGRDFLKSVAFLEWFLTNRGSKVKGFKNAIYTGFPTNVIAEIIGNVLVDFPDLHGLYHVTADPISKHDLLVKMRDRMNLDIEIEPFDDTPVDRSMDSSRFRKATGYTIPSWDDMVEVLAKDNTPYDEWREEHGIA